MYERGVDVRLLGSCWPDTSPDMIRYMRSLSEVNNTGDLNGTMETVRTLPLSLSGGKSIRKPYVSILVYHLSRSTLFTDVFHSRNYLWFLSYMTGTSVMRG